MISEIRISNDTLRLSWRESRQNNLDSTSKYTYLVATQSTLLTLFLVCVGWLWSSEGVPKYPHQRIHQGTYSI
jgi:hypothetical protein